MKDRIISLAFLTLFNFSIALGDDQHVFNTSKHTVTVTNDTENPDSYIPFALTISGGISLGSYEAGLNWALVHYLRIKHTKYKSLGKIYPQLKAITGASAGSINSIVSAISWCVDEQKVDQIRNKTTIDANNYKFFNDTIDNNLFRDVWLEVGMQNLLPKTYKEDYMPDDALFSRIAFKNAIDALTQLLSQPIFREDCYIPIGITLTRVKPTEINIAEVNVQNQRTTIPVIMSSRKEENASGKVQLQPLYMKDAVVNNVVHLPLKPVNNNHTYGTKQGSERFEIKAADMLLAIQASSAFPVAFSRRVLEYCRFAETKIIDGSATIDSNANKSGSKLDFKCPTGYVPDSAEFVDGGIFDNIPLGLVKMLAEPDRYDLNRERQWQMSQRPYNYIYFDPGNRRAFTRTSKELTKKQTEVEEGNGFLNQLSFLKGAFVTGRHYELYNALRDGSWTNQIYAFRNKLAQVIGPDGAEKYPEFKEIRDSIEVIRIKYRGPIGSDTGSISRCEGEKENKCIGEITNQRNQIIEKMVKFANSIGQKQLALEISSANLDKLGDRRLIIPTRYSPITGALLANFGAFFDRPFREYDYYAGVYDAVIELANYNCGSRCENLLINVVRIYQDLGIQNDNKANTVFQYLFEHEFGQNMYQNLVAELGTKKELVADEAMKVVYQSLFSDLTTSDGVHEEPKFENFLASLKKNNYEQFVDKNNVLMRRIINADVTRGAQWAKLVVERISDRLIYLEERLPNSETNVRLPIGVAALLAQAKVDDQPKIYSSRTTAPRDSSTAFWPYTFDIDLRNGGGTVSWEPGVRLGNSQWNAEAKISPFHHNRYSAKEIFFSQTDLFLVRRTALGVMSSWAFGPTFTYTWKEWEGSKQFNIGSSIYVGLFADKLRFTLGQRTGSSNYPDFPGDTAYLYLSITDLPGIYYWLFKKP